MSELNFLLFLVCNPTVRPFKPGNFSLISQEIERIFKVSCEEDLLWEYWEAQGFPKTVEEKEVLLIHKTLGLW
jgi:hypothetical protein